MNQADERIQAVMKKRRGIEAKRDAEESAKESAKAKAANERLRQQQELIEAAKEAKVTSLISKARSKQSLAAQQALHRKELDARREEKLREREAARELRERERRENDY